MAKSKTIRVRLQAYDHRVLDMSVEKIVIAAKKTGASVVGPIPLPTERQVYTILRAVHKYKDSRDQFAIRTHKSFIDIKVNEFSILMSNDAIALTLTKQIDS